MAKHTREELIVREQMILDLLRSRDPQRLEQAAAQGLLREHANHATSALQQYMTELSGDVGYRPIKGWLKALLMAGGDPDAPGHMLLSMTGRMFNEMWVSPVRFAASRGQTQLLKALLCVAREDHRTLLHRYDMTPIEQAAFSGRTECVAMLLDMGVAPHLWISGQEWASIPELRNIYLRWRGFSLAEDDDDDHESSDDRRSRLDSSRYPYGGCGMRRLEDFVLAGANNNYIHGPKVIGHVGTLRMLIERGVVNVKDPAFIDKVAYCAVAYCNEAMLELACEIGADFTKIYSGRKIPRAAYMRPRNDEVFAAGSIASFCDSGVESAPSSDFKYREKFAQKLMRLSASQKLMINIDAAMPVDDDAASAAGSGGFAL